MPAEKPRFTVPKDAVSTAYHEVQKTEPDYYRQLRHHIRVHQPHLFTYLKDVMKSPHITSKHHYELAVFFTYDILKRSQLPFDFDHTQIPENVFDEHRKLSTRMFHDKKNRWRHNRWIWNEVVPEPERKPGEDPTPLSEFFHDIRTISRPFYSKVITSLRECPQPTHKKELIRGIYDVLKPYLAMADIKLLEGDEEWQQYLEKLKSLAESGYMKKETEVVLPAREVVVFGEKLLRQKYHPR